MMNTTQCCTVHTVARCALLHTLALLLLHLFLTLIRMIPRIITLTIRLVLRRRGAVFNKVKFASVCNVQFAIVQHRLVCSNVKFATVWMHTVSHCTLMHTAHCCTLHNVAQSTRLHVAHLFPSYHFFSSSTLPCPADGGRKPTEQTKHVKGRCWGGGRAYMVDPPPPQTKKKILSTNLHENTYFKLHTFSFRRTVTG